MRHPTHATTLRPKPWTRVLGLTVLLAALGGGTLAIQEARRSADAGTEQALAWGSLSDPWADVLTDVTTTLAPTTVAPTTLAPTTVPVTTLAPTTVPATTLPPTTVATTPPPPATTAPPAPVVPPGATGRVVIPAIGMDLAIYRGAQKVIDLGVATWFDDSTGTWRRPVAAGEVGTFWLAGHRTSHGGPFRHVTDLAIGDLVHVVTPQGATLTYRLVERTVVGTSTNMTTVYGNDASARRLLLQTCDGATQRVLYAGLLV